MKNSSKSVLLLALVLTLSGCLSLSGAPTSYSLMGSIVDENNSPLKDVAITFGPDLLPVYTNEGGIWTKEHVSGETLIRPIMAGYSFHPETTVVTKGRGSILMTATPIDQVTFPDPVLHTVIKGLLEVPADRKTVSLASLQEIYSLTIMQGMVQDLEGIQHLSNLQSVQIVERAPSKGGISDLSPLANSQELMHLMIEGHEVSSLAPIVLLPKLQHLWMTHNSLTSLDTLPQILELTEFHAKGNQIVDITPLTRMPSLEVLNLQDNAIKDLKPFLNMESSRFHNLLVGRNPLDANETESVLKVLKSRGYAIDLVQEPEI